MVAPRVTMRSSRSSDPRHDSPSMMTKSHPLLAFLIALASCGGAPSETTTTAESLTGAELAQLGRTGAATGFDLLFITMDTVRADRLGFTGHAGAETPTIDGLARSGIWFEEAIASAPITLPSHATIFTGLDPTEHGVRNNGTYALDESHETLAEALQTEGYRTAAFIGAYVLDARYGLAQGFDHYDDDVNPNQSERVSGHFNERTSVQVTDAAIAWLDENAASAGGPPLFTWVHYFDAHAPYEPGGAIGARFRAQPYDGEIALIDTQVARLLAQLEASGRLERTLVVLTSDHGEGLGEHGEATHSRFIYDSTLRVPLLLSAPALFPTAGAVRDRVVSLADVMPTVLDLLGFEPGERCSGTHLFEASPSAERAIYVESLVPLLNHGWAPLHGLRRANDKFISAPRPEYYDVQADPGELANLFESATSSASALSSQLDRHLDGQGSAAELAAGESGLDRETARRLAALGYVRGQAGGDVGRLDPKDMLPLWNAMNEASGLSERGQHDAALGRIRGVLKKHPKDAYALDVEALVLARMGRNQEAELSLNRCVRLDPTAERYVRLAQLELGAGNLQGMERSLTRAQELDPTEGGISMVRGDALASQGRWDEAEAAFRRAAELDPVKWTHESKAKLEQIRAARR